MKCDDATESSPGNESRMYRRSDWVEFALEIPMAGEPGRDMSYCSAGVMLLGHIIAARAQMKLEEFAATHLLGPLGIVNVRWLHSPMGVTNANSTFQIRPRDMAKFGRLYLDAGAWNGAPVVPAAWVELSYTSSGLMRGGSPYGWLWWKGEFRVGTQMREVLFAAGNGGNHIFVMPTERLVVVITASNYDRQGPSFALMRDLIAHTLQ